MTDHSDLRLDCQTCVAANTTACNECVVTHLLANDDGPIDFVATGLQLVGPRAPGPRHDGLTDAGAEAVDLLGKAGLLDASPVWADRAEFDAGVLTHAG